LYHEKNPERKRFRKNNENNLMPLFIGVSNHLSFGGKLQPNDTNGFRRFKEIRKV
tara:strand:+ start:807 stop:971 length:165 start_codon:yes stop_codon:yes gene_type:complete